MKSELSDQDLLQLTEDAALELARENPELGGWALLQLCALKRAQQAEAAEGISTPSAQIPPYEKPSAKKRPKKRGRKAGHAGVRRPPPLAIDERREHVLERCPDCGAPEAAIYRGGIDLPLSFPSENRIHGCQ
jgi:hypothetical protein